MKKRMLIVTLSLAMVLAPMQVSAAENDDPSVSGNGIVSMDDASGEASEQIAEDVTALMQTVGSQTSQEYISLDFAFESLKDSLVNGGSVSLTQAAAKVDGFSFDYQPQYDVQSYALTGSIDFAQVNYDYENIIGTMQLATDIDLSESPITAMEMFDVVYQGVYEAVQLDDLSIDAMFEGVNVNDALNSVKIEFANSFAESIETGSFATVKDLLSIGSVFQQASNGVPTQSLRDFNYLSSLTAGQNTQNLSLAQANSGMSDLTDMQAQVNSIADWSQVKVNTSNYELVDNGDGSFGVQKVDSSLVANLDVIDNNISAVESYASALSAQDAATASGSPYIGGSNVSWLQQQAAMESLPPSTRLLLNGINNDTSSPTYQLILNGGLAQLNEHYNQTFANAYQPVSGVTLQQGNIDPNLSPMTENYGQFKDGFYTTLAGGIVSAQSSAQDIWRAVTTPTTGSTPTVNGNGIYNYSGSTD